MKHTQQVLSAILIAILIVTATSIVSTTGFNVEAAAYKVGDHINFGTYPQSQIKSAKLQKVFAKIKKTWKSYGYYSGSGEYSEDMKPNNYMIFADFFYKEEKYRAVKFSAFRPYSTEETQIETHSYQGENGFMPGNVYYFKYEPVIWRILNPKLQIVICESIIDAQAYQNTIFFSDGEYWQDSSKSAYANNYESSSIRKWLNYDFYETAFTNNQKKNIVSNNVGIDYFEINNDSFEADYMWGNESKEKIFLFSYGAAMNETYHFKNDNTSYDPERQAQGTDYAKCQGLWVNPSGDYKGKSPWWLRTSSYYTSCACNVSNYGYLYFENRVTNTALGIRPVCTLLKLKNDTNLSSDLFSEIPFEPQGLNASSVKTTSLKLSWNKVADATGYVVYQYIPASKKYTKLGITKTNSFKVLNLKSGTIYSFAVRAYKTNSKKNLFSTYSQHLLTATKPDAPVITIKTGPKTATVSWKKVVGASGYMIYLSNGNNRYKKIAATTNASYTAKNLARGKTYSFKVRTFIKNGAVTIFSNYSTAKSATIK